MEISAIQKARALGQGPANGGAVGPHPLARRSAPLDLLRTVAILLVFMTHFNIFAGDEWFRSVGQFGWIGVDLFFALSGFLITSQLLREMASRGRISLRDFYLRRGLRIWPNYFAMLAVYWAIPAWSERSALPPLWRFLTFTQNFGLDFRGRGAFSHAWSLCVEEQFYLVLPFGLMAFAHRGRMRTWLVALGAVVFGGIALRYALWQHYVGPLYYAPVRSGVSVAFFREIYYPTYCRWDGLAIGVAIAALSRLRPRLWERMGRRANWIFLAAFPILGAALFLVQDEISLGSATFGFALVNLGFACLLVAALLPDGVFSRVRVPGARAAGTLAFSFYLTHKQVIHLAKVRLDQWGVPATSALCPALIFGACVLAAAVLYFAIEKPCLSLRDRILAADRAGV